MDVFFGYLKAFVIGGLFCVVGQILIDKTKLTPAKIMIGFVVAGVLFSAVGLYPKFAEWAGAGATVPIIGFGNTLATGVKKAIEEKGVLGIFTGAITGGAAGVCASIVFGYLAALIFKPGDKS